MSRESFLRLLEEFENKDKYYEALSKRFHAKFKEVFTTLICNYYKVSTAKMEPYREELVELLEEFTNKLWEQYDTVDWARANNNEMKIYGFAPKLKVLDDYEAQWIEMRDLVRGFSVEDYDEAWHRQMHCSDSYREMVDHNFKYLIYHKLKEVFTEVYFDQVIELDSHYLRCLDDLIGFVALEFVERIYGLKISAEDEEDEEY